MQIELKPKQVKEETYAIGDVLLLEEGDAVMLCNVNNKLVAICLRNGNWWNTPIEYHGRGLPISPEIVAKAIGEESNIARKLNVKLVEV